MPLKSFLFSTEVTFSSAGFPTLSLWDAKVLRKDTIHTPALSRRCSSLSLIPPSFSGTFAPLLPLSPPCLSWLSSPHLFSVSPRICKILPVFLPSVNSKSLRLSVYPHEKGIPYLSTNNEKVSHGAWRTAPQMAQRGWKVLELLLFCLNVPRKYMCFI